MKSDQHIRFTEAYRVGREVEKLLPKNATLAEVARHFGRSRQNAHTDCRVALGRLVIKLRRELDIKRRESA